MHTLCTLHKRCLATTSTRSGCWSISTADSAGQTAATLTACRRPRWRACRTRGPGTPTPASPPPSRTAPAITAPAAPRSSRPCHSRCGTWLHVATSQIRAEPSSETPGASTPGSTEAGGDAVAGCGISLQRPDSSDTHPTHTHTRHVAAGGDLCAPCLRPAPRGHRQSKRTHTQPKSVSRTHEPLVNDR